MIKKCYYYCSYNNSRNGYEPTKILFQDELKKYTQSSLNSEDVKNYLDQLYSFTGKIKLYKDKSVNDVILIVNNIHRLLPENDGIRDKYISIMLCGDSEVEMTFMALALINNTKEIVQLIYDSMILKPNEISKNSYTIDAAKILEWNEYAKSLRTNSEPKQMFFFEFLIQLINDFNVFYLSETVDIETASEYLSKNPRYSFYKKDTVFKVVEKKSKKDSAFSLLQIFKRNTLTVLLDEIHSKGK